jgi:hypothetical protein
MVPCSRAVAKFGACRAVYVTETIMKWILHPRDRGRLTGESLHALLQLNRNSLLSNRKCVSTASRRRALGGSV